MISRRNDGKSYCIKKRAIDKFLKDGSQFMLVRRREEDIAKHICESYFKNMLDYLYKASKGRYNHILCTSQTLYFEYIDENGKQTRKDEAGFVRSCSKSVRAKSSTFENVTDIYFEEAFTLYESYLPDEVELFGHIISTVARERRIKVWLIGNSEDRNAPFFRAWGVDVKRQPEGTIWLYNIPSDPPEFDPKTGEQITNTVAVERIEKTKNAQKMRLAGKAGSSIYDGEWTITKIRPLILDFHDKPEHYETLYEVVFESRGNRWLGRFIIDINDPKCAGFWYIEPKTTPIMKDTRVCSDEVKQDFLYTYGIQALNPTEKILFELLRANKVFYNENLTGEEFEREAGFFFGANIAVRR